VVNDGEQCLKFLRKEPPYEKAVIPGLILLDLNMPKVDGKQVLERIKFDENLKTIPVVVLTTSQNERDVEESYERFANSYISKPMDFIEFLDLVKQIEKFWFKTVKLPKSSE
jgi:CheY-like chemotaxis protein